MTEGPPRKRGAGRIRAGRPPQRLATNRAAHAGYLLIAPAIPGFGIGIGIGSLLGVPALLAILGIFAGLIAGFFLVHARFRDL